jgi:hypothetical protein
VDIFFVITTGYVDELDDLLAILAMNSKREGGTERAAAQRSTSG